MYVVGATHPEKFREIRQIVPDHFLLVPGVGAQGGSLSEVCRYGMNQDVGLLVNSSRGILYAGQGEDFAEKARDAAKKLQREMEGILTNS
jgi:orotidine-5'-phosphate decarboxylase